jgi:hypothetical protein
MLVGYDWFLENLCTCSKSERVLSRMITEMTNLDDQIIINKFTDYQFIQNYSINTQLKLKPIIKLLRFAYTP